jgi:tetratricopeptide (TPR) repeat protein
LSVASNKLGDYKITIAKCTEALYIEKNLPKAYFLRAQAQCKVKSFEEAMNDIKEAIKLSPSDKALRDEFEAIKAAKKKDMEFEREAAQKLFSSGLYNEKQAPKKPASGLPDFEPDNNQVFMDIEVEGEQGRVVFELFPK